MGPMMWTAVVDDPSDDTVHGALGLVDPARMESHTLCLWDVPAAQGGSWDRRGVRSATWHGGHLWLLLDDVLVQLDEGLNLLGVHRHPLLLDARRVRGRGGLLLVVGRALDVLLAFDPNARRWPWALQVRAGREGATVVPVDPATELPALPRGLGLEQVVVDGPRLWLSGTGLGELVCIQGGRVVERRSIPRGGTDALPRGSGALYCRPDAGRVEWRGDGKGQLWLPPAAQTVPAAVHTGERGSPGALAATDVGFTCGAWPGVLLFANGEPPAWTGTIEIDQRAHVTDLHPWAPHAPLQPMYRASERYLLG